MDDEKRSDRKGFGIVGAVVYNVGVHGLCGTREEEYEGTCLQAFTEALFVGNIRHGLEAAEKLHGVLAVERLQGLV